LKTLYKFRKKSLSGGGKLVRNIYGNPNSPQTDKLLVPKLPKSATMQTFRRPLSVGRWPLV
jgi:hypothetical protein